ncbi:MAG: ABC transporter permease [Tissierellia bacterium]|nr:ABC transporter permease [Tissierellia bacterium]
MKTFKKVALPYFIWAALFIVVSLLMVVYYGFSGEGGLTLDNFARFFAGSTLKTLARSLRIAFITTVFCLLLGYPLAYIISRLMVGYRNLAIILIMVPMWMNFLLRTYAWVTILSKNGIINVVLRSLGFEGLDLLYREGAVILGMVYNFLPFMVLPIYTVLEKMDQSLLEAAADLGCNRFKSFTKVIFPLSLPGVASGISMVFIPAISTFEITTLLGGNKTNLIGNVIEQQFTITGDWNYGSAISIVLMVFLLLSLFFTGREEEATSMRVEEVVGE